MYVGVASRNPTTRYSDMKFLQRMLDKAVAQALDTRTRTAINNACRQAVLDQTGILIDELQFNADHVQHVLSQVIENKYRKQVNMVDVVNQVDKLTDTVEMLEDRLIDTQNERSLRSVTNEQGFEVDNGIQTGEIEQAANDIIGDVDVRIDDMVDDDWIDERLDNALSGRTFELV